MHHVFIGFSLSNEALMVLSMRLPANSACKYRNVMWPHDAATHVHERFPFAYIITLYAVQILNLINALVVGP